MKVLSVKGKKRFVDVGKLKLERIDLIVFDESSGAISLYNRISGNRTPMYYLGRKMIEYFPNQREMKIIFNKYEETDLSGLRHLKGSEFAASHPKTYSMIVDQWNKTFIRHEHTGI